VGVQPCPTIATQFAGCCRRTEFAELLMRFHRSSASTPETDLMTQALSPVQFFFMEVLAELFEPSVVVISHVGVGLTKLFRNLCKCVSLEKVHSQRFALILGKRLQDPLPLAAPQNMFDGLVTDCT
jgi:hypothetical protein